MESEKLQLQSDLLEQLQGELKCGICRDYSENAVETTCCKRMYCETCITKHAFSSSAQAAKCPSCDAPMIRHRVNDLARRMIEQIPFQCVCEEIMKRSDKDKHAKICPKRLFECKKCENKEFLANDFLEHLKTDHREVLLEESNRLFDKQDSMTSSNTSVCPYSDCDFADSKASVRNHIVIMHPHIKSEKGVTKCPLCEKFTCESFESLITHFAGSHKKELNETLSDRTDSDITDTVQQNTETRSEAPSTSTSDDVSNVSSEELVLKNGAGDKATIARNGKLYCGKVSKIGPFDAQWMCTFPGMNCNRCMKLDLKVRNLEPGLIVNARGLIAKQRWVSIGEMAHGPRGGKSSETGVLAKPYYVCGNMCSVSVPCFYCRDLNDIFSQVQEYEGDQSKLTTMPELSNNNSREKEEFFTSGKPLYFQPPTKKSKLEKLRKKKSEAKSQGKSKREDKKTRKRKNKNTDSAEDETGEIKKAKHTYFDTTLNVDVST